MDSLRRNEFCQGNVFLMKNVVLCRENTSTPDEFTNWILSPARFQIHEIHAEKKKSGLLVVSDFAYYFVLTCCGTIERLFLVQGHLVCNPVEQDFPHTHPVCFFFPSDVTYGYISDDCSETVVLL